MEISNLDSLCEKMKNELNYRAHKQYVVYLENTAEDLGTMKQKIKVPRTKSTTECYTAWVKQLLEKAKDFLKDKSGFIYIPHDILVRFYIISLNEYYGCNRPQVIDGTPYPKGLWTYRTGEEEHMIAVMVSPLIEKEIIISSIDGEDVGLIKLED